ncbi:MAG: peptidyl-prolyl cis-trans isomerase A (cyclophilin A) [Polaribacter sp.]|jgi:peptidyl-prolyl cis-trans isomerase A (cyclophilin A)
MIKKIILVFVLAGLIGWGLWYSPIEDVKNIPEDIIALDGKRIQFETNKGVFEITLSAKLAPKTIENFIQYVNSGFYNGTIFHRVISGVIIQGGGFKSEMKEKTTKTPIVNESNNGLSNILGSVAMARRAAPDSATSQFYINLKDNKKLDYKKGKSGYTVFAQVTKGLAFLTEMSKQKTLTLGIHQNVPSEEIKLISVKLFNQDELIEIARDGEEPKQVTDATVEFKEGVHYQKLESPLPLSNSNRVEVISAFSYGCGHCYGAYAQVEAWKKGHLKEVEFSYFHAVWNKSMRVFAQTYYTAIELKIQEKIHVPLFEAIVINQVKLESKEELADFFEIYGIEKQKFVKVFESQRIIKRVIQAERLTKKFQLASVPEFIVAGKYRVNPMRSGGQNEMFELLNFLVNKEKEIEN